MIMNMRLLPIRRQSVLSRKRLKGIWYLGLSDAYSANGDSQSAQDTIIDAIQVLYTQKNENLVDDSNYLGVYSRVVSFCDATADYTLLKQVLSEAE